MLIGPTNQFRWFRKLAESGRDGPIYQLVLQQLWETSSMTITPWGEPRCVSEWRDVPTVVDPDPPTEAACHSPG